MKPSNTPPAKLHPDLPAGGRRTGGEDWFEACIYLTWQGFAAIRKMLNELKDAAKRGGKQGSGRGILPGSEAVYTVRASSIRLGKDEAAPLMAWVLERSGIVIGLADRETANETIPSGFVRITGEVLSAVGDVRPVWEEVVRWLHQMGATVQRAVPSRVDMAADLPGVAVDPLVMAFVNGQAIRRTRKARMYKKGVKQKLNAQEEDDDGELDTVFWEGRKLSGLCVGTGTMLRIYDKSMECKDLSRRSWLIQQRWGGEDQKHAMRVEFQLRREFLKADKCTPKFNTHDRPVIDTVEDYFENRAELAEYLTTRWVRFVQRGFDIKHTERAIDMPEWTAVQKAFAEWTGGTGDTRTWKPIKRKNISVKDLMAQIRGCAESAFARQGRDIVSPLEMSETLRSSLWEVIEADHEIRSRVAMKRLELLTVMIEDDDGPVLCVNKETGAAFDVTEWCGKRVDETIPF